MVIIRLVCVDIVLCLRYNISELKVVGTVPLGLQILLDDWPEASPCGCLEMLGDLFRGLVLSVGGVWRIYLVKIMLVRLLSCTVPLEILQQQRSKLFYCTTLICLRLQYTVEFSRIQQDKQTIQIFMLFILCIFCH
jgi:hypothetical protein